MTRTAPAPKLSTTTAADATPKRKESARDLVEQVVVAFILAFLIRGFEAEAFVIPTGSMAPTLYGQHKEVTCPECGEVFAANTAHETEKNPVTAASCPNCFYRVKNLAETPSFKGDRILVMKFLYNLPSWLGGKLPARWDVVVFHFPEEPETNYIKRLVGLPGELIRVYFGDILVKKSDGDQPFQIARKSLPQQQAMQQAVWDDGHRPKAFASHPEWDRWKSAGGGWAEPSKGTFKAAAGDWADLGYSHLVPEPRQWEAAFANKPIPGAPRPTLITDLYGYNSATDKEHRDDDPRWYQPHWVGDLTVSFRVKAAQGKGGKLRIDLVEGGVAHRCAIDLETGDAILSRDGKAIGDLAATAVRADGRSRAIAFANVDNRLTLWVDGATPFGDGVTYETDLDKHLAPTAADLKPVTIGVKGGEVEVSDLVLKRDIYYTGGPGSLDYTDSDLARPRANDEDDYFREIFDLLSDPAKFPMLGGLRAKEYAVGIGRYFMMGDNSPASSDSRHWGHKDADGDFQKRVDPWAARDFRATWEVPESHLIGKAFFIYWPHGVPFWPHVPITRDFLFPFRPYVERMKWIR